MPVVFSDLHLTHKTEVICFRALKQLERLAWDWDKHIIFCGDWWEIRYQLSVKLLNRVSQLITHWRQSDFLVDIVPGNHDQVTVQGENALQVFSGKRIRVWTAPAVSESENLGFVPYRKDLTEQLEAFKYVSDKLPPRGVIFGHFGIQGAMMNSGAKDTEGLKGELLKSHELILGHYHKHQQGPTWCYVGSPFQQNYGEAGNKCGCILMDRARREFVELNVGAPKHFIVRWDPESEQLPQLPGGEHDKVRLDINSDHRVLVEKPCRQLLKEAGYDNAQVNIIPRARERKKHQWRHNHGAPLKESALKYVSTKQVTTDVFGRENKELLVAAIERWDA